MTFNLAQWFVIRPLALWIALRSSWTGGHATLP